MVAVVVLQMPADPINKIVQVRAGMGKTGETYLVGKWADEGSSMRSDRVVKNGPVGKAKSGHYIDLALSGKSGQAIKMGSTGKLEVVSYDALGIEGLNWAEMTTVAFEEVIATKLDGQTDDFFTKFKKMNDYEDLFLISPKGLCFYSVEQKGEYRENLLEGQYSNTNLSQLIKEVIATKKYGLVDFASYAPKGNVPAAFIAQPVVSDGSIDVIVALQLSKDGINAVMQQREGMGQTGETILVGSDYLMRSDSFKDPDNHAVITSFANPDKGKVYTPATRAVHEKNEAGIVENMTDYVGDKTTIAYTPVKVSDKSQVVS